MGVRLIQVSRPVSFNRSIEIDVDARSCSCDESDWFLRIGNLSGALTRFTKMSPQSEVPSLRLFN